MKAAAPQHQPGVDNGPGGSTSELRRRKSRNSSRGHRGPSKERRKPEKRRAYSFTAGPNDNITVRGDASAPPVPPLPQNFIGKGTSTLVKAPRSYTQPAEQIQEWQRAPTLHKRSAQEMSRRKSSKKRKEEHTRAAEIKALSANVPTRAATDIYSAGRPMKRESKKVREGLNRNLHNPSSDISLPTAESIRSSFSSDAEQSTAYKVSPFYILAPRPTIRYSGSQPRYASGASLGSDHHETPKRKVSDRVTISPDKLKENKRIDDLADDLSAGELRELMERDQKRKEKKRAAEKIKLERKLAQRQERQREDEAEAKRSGTPPPANLERGVLGREVPDQGVGTSAIVTSSKRRISAGAKDGRSQSPVEAFEALPAPKVHDTVNPNVNSTNESKISVSQLPHPSTKQLDLENVTKDKFPSSPSPVTHQKTEPDLTKILAPVAAVDAASPTLPKRRISDGKYRPPQSWTSFFRRGSKSKRAQNLVPPPSFSNTSRDSMQTSQASQATSTGAQPILHIGYTPVKLPSNIPKRTMSKFREDLPELPMSPPDSRMQSPEVDLIPPIPKEFVDKKSGARLSSDDTHMRYDTPTSGHMSVEMGAVRDEAPNSVDRSIDAPTPERARAVSQSLASIDSEGSWLSGRKNSKRGSAQLSRPLRDSGSSYGKRYRDYTESTEELGIAEDEYFSRLTPGFDDDTSKRQSAGNPMPSSDEEDGSSLASPIDAGRPTWGAVARKPTVVHREPRAKSREGLLKEYDADSDNETEAVLDASQEREQSGESEVRIQRATSVDLGSKHARHISAGSARLLDLKGRMSGEGKRLSVNSDLG